MLGNGDVCEQLQDWLASWRRPAAQADAVQPAEQQQTRESQLSPQSWRGSPPDGNWSEVTLLCFWLLVLFFVGCLPLLVLVLHTCGTDGKASHPSRHQANLR